MPSIPLLHALVPDHAALLARIFGLNALMLVHTLPGLIRGLKGSRAPWRVQRTEAARVIDYLTARQDPSGAWAGVPFYSMLAASCLVALGVPRDDPRVTRALEFSRRVKRRPGGGLSIAAFHSTHWDTSQMIRGLRAASLPVTHPAIARATDFLIRAQTREVPPWDWHTSQVREVAGWPFQPGNVMNPDLDSTAHVLGTLAAIARDHPSPQPDLRACVERARRWLSAMQNHDGGWAAFSIGKPSQPPGAFFTDAPWWAVERKLRLLLAKIGDPSTADVTGRALWAFGALGLDESSPVVARASRFIEETRDPLHRVWWGRWECNYLPSTAYVLLGLAAVGRRRDAPDVRHAIEWLLARQNPDGGFGDRVESYDDPSLAGRAPSSASVTGVVLSALVAMGLARDPSAARAASYLAETQEDGAWRDRHCYGVLFPMWGYYHNDTFPTYLALEALGSWREAVAP